MGFPENTKEHLEVEKKAKFSYQGLLGELLYAFVMVHVEIGNAIKFLSKFSSSPHPNHYTTLKNVCQYLQKHKSEGLIYWHTKPINFLPEVPFETVQMDLQLLPFSKWIDRSNSLCQWMAHATDTKTCQSLCGYFILYGGAVVVYKAKLQPTVATSSTEAEFIAAVYAAKAIKHLHSILSDLGLLIPKPFLFMKITRQLLVW